MAGNRELIERFEKKVQQTLARVWGEPETAALAEAEIAIVEEATQ